MRGEFLGPFCFVFVKTRLTFLRSYKYTCFLVYIVFVFVFSLSVLLSLSFALLFWFNFLWSSVPNRYIIIAFLLNNQFEQLLNIVK